MVPEADLVARLQQILRRSDLDTATPGSVRRQLEEDFSVDLSDRKAFITDQIDIYLQTLLQEASSDAEEEQNKADEQDPENVESDLEEENDTVEPEEDQEQEEESEGREDKRRGVKNVNKEVKKRGGGFNKLCSLSPLLQKVVGAPKLARTEVVKKVWAYIRENNLQDPKNKRNIICDESLRALFRVKSINMFQMNKALSKHIWPLSEGDGFHNELQHYFPTGDIDNGKEEEEVKGEQGEENEEEIEEENKEENEKENEEEEDRSCGQGSKTKKSRKADKDSKKRRGGFTKLCNLSPRLEEFIGVPQLARTEVVKKLWSYIREKKLQDPKNRRKIICDESLHALFRVNSIDMFQMNKALSKHIWPLEDGEGVPDDSAEKGKQSKRGQEEDVDKPKQKEKRQKKGGSGFLSRLPLSDALVKFIGTGENALSRADVVKRMWEYIKQNDLQDPSDKRRIICDDKLKELFEVDTFHGFSVSKLLTPHFIKTEHTVRIFQVHYEVER